MPTGTSRRTWTGFDHPDGPRILILGAVDPKTPFSASMPLYAALTARAIVPEAPVLVVDARPAVRAHAGRLGIDAGEPNRVRHERAPLVIDSSADPHGLALAIAATAPDGICSCAGTLHASVRVPGTLMFGRNITLALMRSHIRTVIPAVLDLVGRLASRDHAMDGAAIRRQLLIRSDRSQRSPHRRALPP